MYENIPDKSHHYRLETGQNLSNIFKEDIEYCCERLKIHREKLSQKLNYTIYPIHILENENLAANEVQLIDERIEFMYNFQKYGKNINHDLWKRLQKFKMDGSAKDFLILHFDHTTKEGLEVFFEMLMLMFETSHNWEKKNGWYDLNNWKK